MKYWEDLFHKDNEYDLEEGASFISGCITKVKYSITVSPLSSHCLLVSGMEK